MCLRDGRPDGVTATTQQRHVCDDTGRNVNNSSASVTRRLFSQVDRLLEGSSEDRKRALELLTAKEQQVTSPAVLALLCHMMYPCNYGRLVSFEYHIFKQYIRAYKNCKLQTEYTAVTQ